VNQIRIIAGKWRGRKISFLDQKGLRPSPDRVRETLFNWLQFDIVGTHCLDLFAGSGILALEACSRGAKQVTCIELNRETASNIKNNIELLQAEEIFFLQQNALEFLQTSNKNNKYDLVFLDPPFKENLLEPSIALLESNSWLAKSALIYLESDQPLEDCLLPENWTLVKNKKAGQVYYGLCQRTG
jgi:16S rRNA (guanine966-N2)-methyltransferase